MARVIQLSPIAHSSYETQARLVAGMAAGFIASLSIVAIVTAALVITGNDIWTAVRLIATAVYGQQAAVGWLPIAAGTVLHLVTGTLFGALFARIVPQMPANIYVVAGMIYGLLTWAVMALIVLPLAAPLLIATNINVMVLLFAHVVYGFVLGIAGGVIELLWAIPKTRKV